MFLDGTWATTNMARRHGRAPRGRRALDAVPHGRWRTTTVVAAPRADGIAAPSALEGAIDGPGFLAHVERALAPTLPPAGAVAADGLGSRKAAGVREAVEAAGASLLRLPPYSPDSNPVEPASSEPKRPLRAAAARSADAPRGAVGAALGHSTAAERGNRLRHCGCAQSAR